MTLSECSMSLVRGLCLSLMLLHVTASQFLAPIEAADSPRKYALLVGCTSYPNNRNITPLWGPQNDVRLLADVLKNRLGFNADNIVILSGEPTKERGPTRGRIVAAFDRLIAKAQQGDRIVIQMNGHGTQLPTQPGTSDRANWFAEPDGLDEVFLPADTGRWRQGDVENALRDNEIADWLRALKQRGAHVWVLFDCCHSGTMMRSFGPERYRSVLPAQLGLPARAQSAVRQKKPNEADKNIALRGGFDEQTAAPTFSHKSQAPLALPNDDSLPGSVTAFYACQPYEKAPEIPQPRSAPRAPEHYYGLLTFTVCEILQQAEAPLTYRALAEQIIARYRGKRGSRGPTPMFEGALDLPVFENGLAIKANQIFLEQHNEQLRIPGGLLKGWHPGTILAASKPRADSPIFGYVRVIDANPERAIVESVAWNGRPRQDKTQLTGCECRVATYSLGNQKTRLALSPQSDSDLQESHELVRRLVARLPRALNGLVQVVSADQSADWSLQLVSIATAKQDYKLKRTEPRLLLLTPTASGARVVQDYALREPRLLEHSLSRDLRKITLWQNLWRIAVSPAMQREFSEIRFDVQTQDESTTHNTSKEVSPRHVLTPGERLVLDIENESFDDQWVTLIYLDANFGVHVWLSTSLKSGQKLRPLRVRIDETSVGSEGFILFTVPVTASRIPPDYAFLKQSPLGVADRAQLQLPANATPFQQLLATYRKTAKIRFRGETLSAPSTPRIQSWTWTTRASR